MDNIHAAWWKLYVDVPYEDIVLVSLSVLYITSCVESCRLAGFLLGVEIWKNIIIFMVIWKSLAISWKVWKFYKNCLKSPVKSGKIFKTILVEIFDAKFWTMQLLIHFSFLFVPCFTSVLMYTVNFLSSMLVLIFKIQSFLIKQYFPLLLLHLLIDSLKFICLYA